MALNDTLSNVMSTINNCEKVCKQVCIVKPISKLINNVLQILNDNQFIGSFKTIDEARGGIIEVNLLGNINKCGVIKPRFSVKLGDYEKFEKRFLPAKDVGIIIMSTSQGLMTHNQAIEKKLGGKLIAYCY